MSLHSEVICLEYVPQRGKTGTYPWDVYPKMAFWVHIQSVILQVIDINDGSEDSHSAVREGNAQEI